MSKIKTALKTIIVIMMCLGGIYGVPVRDSSGLKTNVGLYTIEPYQYGLTINNDYKSFYNVSPYNFYVKSNGAKLFDWSENVFAKEWHNNNRYMIIWSNFLAALGKGNVLATLSNSEKNFIIEATVKNNSLKINYSFTPQLDQTIVQTLSFNKDDLVLDDKLRILNNSDNIDLAEIEHRHRIKIIKADTTNTLGRSIFIMNTNNVGVIKINLNDTKSITINNQDKLIEMEPKTNTQNTMNLKLYNSINEAIEEKDN